MTEQATINRPARECQSVMDMKIEASIGRIEESVKGLKHSVDELRNDLHGREDADKAIMVQLNAISQRLTILETTQRDDREAAKRWMAWWATLSPVLGAAAAWMLMRFFGG